jgi:hypothetical protein
MKIFTVLCMLSCGIRNALYFKVRMSFSKNNLKQILWNNSWDFEVNQDALEPCKAALWQKVKIRLDDVMIQASTQFSDAESDCLSKMTEIFYKLHFDISDGIMQTSWLIQGTQWDANQITFHAIQDVI